MLRNPFQYSMLRQYRIVGRGALRMAGRPQGSNAAGHSSCCYCRKKPEQVLTQYLVLLHYWITTRNQLMEQLSVEDGGTTPRRELTAQQLVILRLLLEGGSKGMSGRQLRERLQAEGIKKQGPNFYQMVGRLEDADLVETWYVDSEAKGVALRETYMRPTKLGMTTWLASMRSISEELKKSRMLMKRLLGENADE